MKRIKNYDYWIDKNANIYNKDKKVLKPQMTTSGYYRVILHSNKKMKGFAVHRLLAEYYLPKIEGKNFINHKDGNKINNKLENLEWCTLKENSQHSYKIGLNTHKGENCHFSKLNKNTINNIRFLLEYYKPEHKVIAKMFNISLSYVRKLSRNVAWKDYDKDENKKILREDALKRIKQYRKNASIRSRKGRNKLTINEIKEMKTFKNILTYKEIGEFYCIGNSNVHRLLNGKSYKGL